MFDLNSHIIQKLVKYYTHYQKIYHIVNECDQIINKLYNNKNKFKDDSFKKKKEKLNNKRFHRNSFKAEIYVAYYIKKNYF